MEIKVKLPWGDVQGKWWGPTNVQPILCFHGWQDNCGVYDRLIPLLPKEFSYLALDIPGHGLSSSYGTGGQHYGVVDTLLFIENVRKAYGWKQIGIIGHSMMASVSFLYAAVFPEQTQFLVCLDNLAPQTIMEVDDNLRMTVEKLLIENERLHQGNEPPSYEYEVLLQRIFEGSFQSVNPENCKYLVPRGVTPSSKYPGRYFFKRDARVKYFNGLRISQEDNLKMASRMRTPLLLLIGDSSPLALKRTITTKMSEKLEKKNPSFTMRKVPGNHHFFLNNPDTCSKVIEQFIYEWTSVKNKL